MLLLVGNSKTVFTRTGLLISALLCYILFKSLQNTMCYNGFTPSIITDNSSTLGYSVLSRCELNTEDNVLDCPDARARGETPQRQAHLVLTRLLRIFHLITVNHGVNYWLYGGTLLGAVRHKGHNPYNDQFDVDIAIYREDFEIFFRYLSSELPKDMRLETKLTDAAWNITDIEAKIIDKNSCIQTCLSEGCKQKHGFQMNIYVMEKSAQNLMESFTVSRWLAPFLKTPLHRPYFSDILPLRQMEFDGFYFPVPHRWDKVLKTFYDDYMTLPESLPEMPQIQPLHACEESN